MTPSDVAKQIVELLRSLPNEDERNCAIHEVNQIICLKCGSEHCSGWCDYDSVWEGD